MAARVVFKPSVRVKALTPALVALFRGALLVGRDWADSPELVITSVNDSTHGPNSRHYVDEAIDVRVHNQPTEAARVRLAQAFRAVLGPAFTVLYEGKGTPNAHLHVQPKKGSVFSEIP